MSSEKRSDSWIGKLDGLESLPGEAPFDKMAAWDRLHSRLDRKERKKRSVWYWAAACLLLACIASVLPELMHKKAVPPPASRVFVKDPDVPKQQVVISEPVPTKTGEVPVEKKIGRPKEKTCAIVSDIAVILPPAIKFIPHTDTILAETTAVAAVPRKMRVVHINEVGGEVIGNAYVYPEHKQFKVAISGPAGFASQVVADKTSKTTISPKN